MCSQQALWDSDQSREKGRGSRRGAEPLHVLGATVNSISWAPLPARQDPSSWSASFQGTFLCSGSPSLMGTVAGGSPRQLAQDVPVERGPALT